MTETSKTGTLATGRHPARATDETLHTVVVPNSINMVALLGPGDEHLALMEKAFEADIHVRGNQVTLRGEPAEVALAERMLDELVTIIRTGQGDQPRDRRARDHDAPRGDHRAAGRRALASTSCPTAAAPSGPRR